MAPAEVEYEQKTVIMIKAMLAERNLSKVGKKADLIIRLEEDDKKRASERQQAESKRVDAENDQIQRSQQAKTENEPSNHQSDYSTVTEGIIKDLQAPRTDRVSSRGRGDTAAGPSIPMLLNPEPETSRLSVSPHVQEPLQTNDAEELRRKREADEADVENAVSKRLKSDIDEAPIGGSALLKEEVPAFRRQISNTKSDFFDIELTGEAHQNSSTALHEPTSAIYVRNLTRPINLHELQEHIQNIAGQKPESVFLNSIKSHAYIQFADAESASKARDGMHEKVWPDETHRKKLWVDFIPVEAVTDFTKQENAAPKGSKFEVTYDGSLGSMTVALKQEGVSNLPMAATDEEAKPAKRIIKLDELFQKTVTKPVLYYLPAILKRHESKNNDNVHSKHLQD